MEVTATGTQLSPWEGLKNYPEREVFKKKLDVFASTALNPRVFLYSLSQLNGNKMKWVGKEWVAQAIEQIEKGLAELETGKTNSLQKAYFLLEKAKPYHPQAAELQQHVRTVLLRGFNITALEVIKLFEPNSPFYVEPAYLAELEKIIQAGQADTLKDAETLLYNQSTFGPIAGMRALIGPITEKKYYSRLPQEIRDYTQNWPPVRVTDSHEFYRHFVWELEAEHNDRHAAHMLASLVEIFAPEREDRRWAREAKHKIANGGVGRWLAKLPYKISPEELAATLLSGGVYGSVKLSGEVGLVGGAVMVTTYIASKFRPLRALAAAGLSLVSKRFVAKQLLVASIASSVKYGPAAVESAQNIFAQGRTPQQRAADTLMVASYSVGILGNLVGLNAFGMGMKQGNTVALQARNAGVFTASEVNEIAAISADAMRRKLMDPQYWIYAARGIENLTPWKRDLIVSLGKFWDQVSVNGNLALASSRLILGGVQVYGQSSSPHFDLTSALGNLGIQGLLDFMPSLTTKLYRAGRGDKNYGVGPAAAEDFATVPYTDKNLQAVVKTRLEKAMHPLGEPQREKFKANANKDLEISARQLEGAESLPSLMQPQRGLNYSPVNGYPYARQNDLSLYTQLAQAIRQGDEATAIALLNDFSIDNYHAAYKMGVIDPVQVLKLFLKSNQLSNSNFFPRHPGEGDLGKELMALAEASRDRYQKGQPLGYDDGVILGVKDLVPDITGKMQLGSRDALVVGASSSPLITQALGKGMLPIPIGMCAYANGGSGMNAGHGYIPHPTLEGKDVGGSSNVSAFLASKPQAGEMRLRLPVATSSDTGGSSDVPAALCGLTSCVPPRNTIDRRGMVPFDERLDRLGFMGRYPQDVMRLAKDFSAPQTFSIATEIPTVAYLQSLADKASPSVRAAFLNRMGEYGKNGYRVVPLGPEWDFLAEVPRRLYPLDAYVGTAFTAANPLQQNKLGEPPRYSTDPNINLRTQRGLMSMEEGFADRACMLNDKLGKLVGEKLGPGVVMAFPPPEPIDTAFIVAGQAGELLDGHDDRTMLKNRIPGWGSVTLPSINPQKPYEGAVYMGPMGNLMHLMGEATMPNPQAVHPSFLLPMGETSLTF